MNDFEIVAAKVAAVLSGFPDRIDVVERRSQAVLWGLDHGFLPDRVRHR